MTLPSAIPYQYFTWPGLLPTDVRFDAFLAELDVYAFNWDLAVWWNRDLAEAAQVIELQNQIGALYDPLDWMRSALEASDGYQTLQTIVGRLPRTEARCAEQLAPAIQHVVKANSGARPVEWMVYSHERGVWRREGEEGVSAIVADCVLRFGLALGRAVDAVYRMLDVVEPDPGPNPGTSAPAGVLEAWEEATARRTAIKDAAKPAKEMARAIPRGKYTTIRAELKKRVEAPPTAWDSDTQWLVLRDGRVNVEEVYAGTGMTLYPHAPDIMSTMALDVAWADEERNAGRSAWELGVEKVLPDPEVRAYLKKRFGAALLGRPGIAGKSMVWQYGPGDTAKSTLQECVAGARGVFAPYSIVTSSEVLTERGGERGSAERFKAYARGKRFVLMSELRDGEFLSQEVVKSVTGGETVEGTAKFQNAVSYFFTATLFMASNHPPSFPPGDTALVGRIHVVPFEHRLWVRSKNPDEWEKADPEHRADEDWAKHILDSSQERRAIFAWVLEGLEEFGREGIGKIPEAMLAAREDFAADADPVGRLVRTLTGAELDYSGPAWLKVLSDTEWESEGLFDGDGVQVPRLEEMLNTRARELGMVKFGDDGLSNKWMRAAKRMLHEMGGRKRKAMVDRDSRKIATCYTRVMVLEGAPSAASNEPDAAAAWAAKRGTTSF